MPFSWFCSVCGAAQMSRRSGLLFQPMPDRGAASGRPAPTRHRPARHRCCYQARSIADDACRDDAAIVVDAGSAPTAVASFAAHASDSRMLRARQRHGEASWAWEHFHRPASKLKSVREETR